LRKAQKFWGGEILELNNGKDRGEWLSKDSMISLDSLAGGVN